MKRPPFRIAFRSEGSDVNAYFALGDTMEGAVLIASIRRGALNAAPGAFEDYQALMRKIVNAISGDLFVEFQTIPAPENERTGNA